MGKMQTEKYDLWVKTIIQMYLTGWNAKLNTRGETAKNKQIKMVGWQVTK